MNNLSRKEKIKNLKILKNNLNNKINIEINDKTDDIDESKLTNLLQNLKETEYLLTKTIFNKYDSSFYKMEFSGKLTNRKSRREKIKKEKRF